MAAFFDISLAFDASGRRFDLVLGADGDLVADTTPVTPMLISLGVDRRARPDDALPTGRDSLLNADLPGFAVRRGFSGDVGDARSRRTGSHIWLLDRAKQDEITRMAVADHATEALSWAREVTGDMAVISVFWERRGVLALTARLGEADIIITRGF